jgi:hypothetical protein
VPRCDSMANALFSTDVVRDSDNTLEFTYGASAGARRAPTNTAYDTTLLGQSNVLHTTGYALNGRNIEKQFNYCYYGWSSLQRAVGLESGAERAIGGPLSGGSCGSDSAHLRLKGASEADGWATMSLPALEMHKTHPASGRVSSRQNHAGGWATDVAARSRTDGQEEHISTSNPTGNPTRSSSPAVESQCAASAATAAGSAELNGQRARA